MENFLTAIFEKLWSLLEDYLFPFKIINEYESGVILRLGKFNRLLPPGFNWKYPLIEKALHIIHKTNTFHVSNVNITTLDNKTISVGAILEYSVIDSKKYILEFNDTESNMHDIARGIISDYLTDCTWEECKKKSTLTSIKNKMKKQFDEMGVEIYQVLFGDIVISPSFTLFNHQ